VELVTAILATFAGFTLGIFCIILLKFAKKRSLRKKKQKVRKQMKEELKRIEGELYTLAKSAKEVNQ
jgi:hypothetical protein